MASELTLAAPHDPTVRITSRSGSVQVTGEQRADVVVKGARHAEVLADGSVEVKGRSGSVTVRCSEGSDVIIGTGSGNVELKGRLGHARVTVGSGSISAERIESLDARTASGSFVVGECSGECSLKTASGGIKVTRAGEADLATGSGSVNAEVVDGAKVKAGSGNVDIGLSGPGTVDVKAMSGSITISVPRGLRPATRLMTLSGKVQSETDTGDDGEIRVKTLSGSIRVVER
jgi:DUF4097 and DUF4098 domain-containing protein YvlB